jgi:hypothetical protein
MKSIVILATTHENQIVGNARSSGLEQRVDYFKSKLGVQIVMEEWSKKKGKSAAETFTNKSGFPWANVGTPDEPQFRTYRGPVNYPGYDGTVPSDPDAPPLSEYGPFENQEAREDRMAKNVQSAMEKYQTGLFLLGLAHLHSMIGKLRALGFKVTAFSWLDR